MMRILIVDDNASAAHATAALLVQWGHEVRLALDGASAIAAARAWRPQLVLLDIGLPGMDGFDVAATLRLEPALAACRIIAMSGLCRTGDSGHVAEAGIELLLAKPLDIAFLRSLVGDAACARPAPSRPPMWD
ncbi:MAG TPA: response regulator [Burkholderiales bacterium]|nr:response regulator [Burkholderiales bacterium]